MAKHIDVLLLVNAMMGQLISGVATRIFIVSLPTIAAALNADILSVSWALISYQLAGICLSVVFGRLGDIHGRYPIYGVGFVIMTIPSFLCGVARSADAIGVGQTGVMIVVFALTLAGFLVHERRAVNPVVNLALFRIRMFVFSVLSLLVFAITSSVLTFLLPFYLQDVLHHSPSFI